MSGGHHGAQGHHENGREVKPGWAERSAMMLRKNKLVQVGELVAGLGLVALSPFSAIPGGVMVLDAVIRLGVPLNRIPVVKELLLLPDELTEGRGIAHHVQKKFSPLDL